MRKFTYILTREFPDKPVCSILVDKNPGVPPQLRPYASQRIYNHSPDGFEWGYEGSGPAQLALAILLDYFTRKGNQMAGTFAASIYQDFKRQFIANIPQGGGTITSDEIGQFITKISAEKAGSQ